MKIGLRHLFVAALVASSSLPVLADSAAEHPSIVSVEGKVRQPQRFDLAALQKLPAETVEVSFNSERGVTKGSFTGPRLWAVLEQAGGIDDPDEKAALHHTVKVTASDGYFVVLSTGEIAPDFGGKPALLGYRRDSEPPGASGFRLVMPGDKRGGRNVRDIVTIAIE